jgi:hypothetical protein
VGTASGTPVPAGVALLQNFTVARRYRGGKPRIYLPVGTSATLQNASTWTSGFVTSMNAAWASASTFIPAAAPSGTTITGQVSVSYYKDFTVFIGSTGRARNISTLRTGGPVIDSITAATVNAKPASQRRRNLQRK